MSLVKVATTSNVSWRTLAVTFTFQIPIETTNLTKATRWAKLKFLVFDACKMELCQTGAILCSHDILTALN